MTTEFDCDALENEPEFAASDADDELELLADEDEDESSESESDGDEATESADHDEDDAGQDDAGEDDAGEDDAGEDDAGEDDAGEDDAGEDDDDEDVVDMDDLEAELEEEALREDVLMPGPDANAEPYWAVMVLEDGSTTGQLWTFGGKMMLFGDKAVAEKVQGALQGGEIDWGLRGVDERHLKALKLISEGQDVQLFVVAGFTKEGKVEAVPLRIDEARRKGPKPPPLPPKG